MCSKSKAIASCIIIVFPLLFTFSSCASAARPQPAAPYAHHATPIKVQYLVEEDSCDGIEEEECLMRRTLAAHLDYIYTQKNTNP
ncbi:phytosulfokines-like [Gossypium australe]|uniref:Phytosulfokine n=1 Tax=Gossypium australe TaxID=47621 RepID=A0A5B6WY61_9ROSI|nr:phytosulfokines-like [Gossypium australe]